MLGHRLRRRPNIGQTMGRGVVFVGFSLGYRIQFSRITRYLAAELMSYTPDQR